jgi:hypothetical protein
MPVKNNKFRSSKKYTVYSDESTSYNTITPNKKHRIVKRHCSSCGVRLKYKFSLKSPNNLLKKDKIKNKTKKQKK